MSYEPPGTPGRRRPFTRDPRNRHGLIGYSGMLTNLPVIDACATSVGLVRAEANDATAIGRHWTPPGPLPAATPPVGRRSYGPMRSVLRIGPVPVHRRRHRRPGHDRNPEGHTIQILEL